MAETGVIIGFFIAAPRYWLVILLPSILFGIVLNLMRYD